MVATKPVAAQRIVLHDVSWETYEHLLADQVNRSSPRFTYDQGVLEITSPGPEHESARHSIEFLISIVAGELNIPIRAVGSMTYRAGRCPPGIRARHEFLHAGFGSGEARP